jgi:hypothetical protein
MGETTNQIESYIKIKRDDLGSNLHELETKVKSMTDWKYHFENRPATLLAVAFGGGILLATMMGGRKKRVRAFSDVPGSRMPYSSTTNQIKDKAFETWDHVKGALIGLAAVRVKEYIGEVIPGFKEQFDRHVHNERGSSLTQ